MKPLKAFTIKFVGLKLGEHYFEYQIDKTFFEYFEYDEYNDVKVTAKVKLTKKTTLLEFSFAIKGAVNLHCDLTNELFDQPISNSFDLVVKFGEEYNDENEELLIIPHGEYELNIAQYLYELIVLSVPQKRVHPGVKNGTLQSDILKKLEDLSPEAKQEKEEEATDPRWNILKKLLTDK
jgi:uncharacterized metal-binding protein YceD (DUF177 family)